MNCKTLFGLLLFLASTTATAESTPNTTIISANNEAAVDFLYGYQAISPINNVFNAQAEHANLDGVQFVLDKTFLDHRLYTQLAMQTLTGSFYLSNTAPGSNTFISANSFQQQISARVGYSFYPTNTIALTPYALLGFQYWQIDTPGTFQNVRGGVLAIDGYTRIYQNGFYGLGLLTQWAVTPKWVMSMDANVGETIHPWVRYNYIVTSPSSSYNGKVIYQQADLKTQPFYQFSLFNDYQLTSQLHARFGLTYLHQLYGGGTTSPALDVYEPSMTSHTWLANVGMGYSFAGKDQNKNTFSFGNQETIEHANNQANIQLGYLYQNYGEMSYSQMLCTELKRSSGGDLFLHVF